MMKIEVRNGAVTIEGYVNVTERLSKPIHDVRGNFQKKYKVVRSILHYSVITMQSYASTTAENWETNKTARLN